MIWGESGQSLQDYGRPTRFHPDFSRFQPIVYTWGTFGTCEEARSVRHTLSHHSAFAALLLGKHPGMTRIGDMWRIFLVWSCFISSPSTNRSRPKSRRRQGRVGQAEEMHGQVLHVVGPYMRVPYASLLVTQASLLGVSSYGTF